MSETRTKQPSCNLFANSPQNDCHVPESYQLRANPIFGSPRSPSILPRRRWTDRNLDIIDDVKIPFPTSKTSHKCWLESVAATETTRSRSIGSATCVCENLVSLSLLPRFFFTSAGLFLLHGLLDLFNLLFLATGRNLPQQRERTYGLGARG